MPVSCPAHVSADGVGTYPILLRRQYRDRTPFVPLWFYSKPSPRRVS